MGRRLTDRIRNNPSRKEFLEEYLSMKELERFFSKEHLATMDLGLGRGMRLYRMPSLRNLPHYSEWELNEIDERVCHRFWNTFSTDGACTDQELLKAKVSTLKCLYYRELYKMAAVEVSVASSEQS